MDRQLSPLERKSTFCQYILTLDLGDPLPRQLVHVLFYGCVSCELYLLSSAYQLIHSCNYSSITKNWVWTHKTAGGGSNTRLLKRPILIPSKTGCLEKSGGSFLGTLRLVYVSHNIYLRIVQFQSQLDAWFQRVKDLFKKTGLDSLSPDELSWNCDETGFCTATAAKKILARHVQDTIGGSGCDYVSAGSANGTIYRIKGKNVWGRVGQRPACILCLIVDGWRGIISCNGFRKCFFLL